MRKNSIQNSQARANAHAPPRTEGGWGAALQSLAIRKNFRGTSRPYKKGRPTCSPKRHELMHLLDVLCPCSQAVTPASSERCSYNVMVISISCNHNPLPTPLPVDMRVTFTANVPAPARADEHTWQPQHGDVDHLFTLLDTLDI